MDKKRVQDHMQKLKESKIKKLNKIKWLENKYVAFRCK